MEDLEKKAIRRIQTASEMSLWHYGLPLVCTYSGGKDSDVMLELFRRSRIPFEVQHSHTTADAPQTVYHIRNVFKKLELQGIKCTIDYHRIPGTRKVITMWNLIPYKLMPPTRRVRYCCSVLKESYGKQRFIATGVRWDESSRRKTWGSFSDPKNKRNISDEIMLMDDNDKRRLVVESCIKKNKMIVNPLIDWKDADIWTFIAQEHLKTNPLYECGYSRVGCIGCPMSARKRYREFADFPKYKNAYIASFDRMLVARALHGKKSQWKNGQEVFSWWMEENIIPGQMVMDDFIEVD